MPIKIPETIQEEIIKVLDYLYKDEKRHYEETYLDEDGNIIDPEDKSRLNHIFISLDKIAKHFNY